jgi:hypothetical protein
MFFTPAPFPGRGGFQNPLLGSTAWSLATNQPYGASWTNIANAYALNDNTATASSPNGTNVNTDLGLNKFAAFTIPQGGVVYGWEGEIRTRTTGGTINFVTCRMYRSSVDGIGGNGSPNFQLAEALTTHSLPGNKHRDFLTYDVAAGMHSGNDWSLFCVWNKSSDSSRTIHLAWLRIRLLYAYYANGAAVPVGQPLYDFLGI